MNFKEQLRLLPFVRFLLPLIGGILIQLNVPIPLTFFYLWFISLVLFVSLVLFQTIKKDARHFVLFGLLLNCFLIFSGITVTKLRDDIRLEESISKGSMIGIVIEPVKHGEKTEKTMLEIEAIKSGKTWIHAKGNVVLYFRKDSLNDPSKLKLGDKIIFNVDLQNPSEAKNPNEFDYKNYLAFHLITKQAFLKAGQWQKLGNNIPTGNISLWAASVQQKVISIFRQANLNQDNLSIISALTVGYKDLLSAQIKQSFSQTGAMHVLAVSGLHVGIIYFIMNFFLSLFIKRKGLWIKSVVLILILWGYALMTGLSPSVLRASVMFSFVVIGQNMKRTKNIYNTIAASAFILLLFNPYNIVEIGFWLSYLAVLGIIFLHPKIHGLIYFGKSFFARFADNVWSLVAVSIAAQISTFPIGLYFFHQFPNYFILTNLWVIPLVSVIVYISILLIAVSPVSIAFNYMSTVLDWILSFMFKGIHWIQSLPFAFVDDISITKYQMVLFYGLIISVIILFSIRKKAIPIIASFSLIIFLLGLSIYGDISKNLQRKIIIYNLPRETAYNFIDGTDNIMFSSVQKQDKQINFHIKSNWLALGVENEKVLDIKRMSNQYFFRNYSVIQNPHLFLKNNFIGFYNKKLIVLNKDYHYSNNMKTNQKIKVDYILLSQNCPITIQTILRLFDFRKLIIDASNSRFRVNKWKEQCSQSGIDYYDITENGAFIKDLTLRKNRFYP